jgi:hypothetical protein
LAAAAAAIADEPLPAEKRVTLPAPALPTPPGYRWLRPVGLPPKEGVDESQPPAWLSEQLAKAKVPTLRDAEKVAFKAVPPTSGIYDAVSRNDVVGVLQLGRKVAKFGEQGDLVWVARVTRLGGGVTQELWISSTTGEVRMMLPAKIEE